jgi:hypothetical protein
MIEFSRTRMLRKTELEKYMDKILRNSPKRLDISSRKIKRIIGSEHSLRKGRWNC